MTTDNHQIDSLSDKTQSVHRAVGEDAIGGPNLRFQSGGALRDGAVYVERPADTELYCTLLAGDFAYVLAPRQIGKTSLRDHTARRLRQTGVRCATIDLTRFGATETAEERWYFDLLDAIATQLDLPDQVDAWNRGENRSPLHRFSLFLHETALGQTNCPIVIFIDEIDHVLQLPFDATEFFSAIRAIFNARASEPIFERLTFCLLGVSTPQELTRDPQRSPFNIGHAIRLEDFTLDEALPAFTPALATLVDSPEDWLIEVFRWTDGQPYMTQRLCVEVASQAQRRDPRAVVDTLVDQIFLQRGRVEETLLANAEARFFNSDHAPPLPAHMLRIYRQLLDGFPVPSNGSDPAQLELRLCGLAADRERAGQSWLCVRNRVFAEVFDQTWVRERETRQVFSDALDNWMAADRSADYLLKGQALDVALSWTRGREDIQPEEHEFLSAGLEAARREAQEKQLASEALVEREQRARADDKSKLQRRIIRTLALAFFLLICASFAISIFYWRTLVAERKKVRAEEDRFQALENFENAQKQADKEKFEAEKARKGAAQYRDRAVTAEQSARETAKLAGRIVEISEESLRKEKVARRRLYEAQRLLEVTQRYAEEAKSHAQQLEEAVQRLQGMVQQTKERADKEATERAAQGGKTIPRSSPQTSGQVGKSSLNQPQRSPLPRWRGELAEKLGAFAIASLSDAIRLSSCGADRLARYHKLLDDHSVSVNGRTELTSDLLATLLSESHVAVYPSFNNSQLTMSSARAEMLKKLAIMPQHSQTRYIILSHVDSDKDVLSDDLTRRVNWVSKYLNTYGIGEDKLMTLFVADKEFAFDSRILRHSDRTTVGELTSERAIWIFRTDCF